MDAVAGFEGHRVRTERQIHRINRAERITTDDAGKKTVVYASYEDPSQPDVIHNRIIRAPDYLAANSERGVNYQQHSQAILVFLFTYWEDEVRPKLAVASSKDVDEIKSDIMGDLRILRNVILHSKGILKKEKHRSLKKLNLMFLADQALTIKYEDMHQIFVLVKQDLARLVFDWLGVKNPEVAPEELKDIAIQFKK